VARPASTAATTRARTSPCCGAVGLATHVGLAAVRPTSSSGPADASPGSAAGRRRRARAALGGQPAGGVLLRLPTAWRVAHSRRTHPPGRTLHPRCTALVCWDLDGTRRGQWDNGKVRVCGVRLVRRADGGAYEDGGEPDVQVDGGIGQGIR
jgi:hypothetical protein